MPEGKRKYLQSCAPCHMEDGAGLVDWIPPLTSQSLSLRRQKSICLIHNGILDSVGLLRMPPFKTWSNTELANVLNYINQLQESKALFFTESEIEKSRVACSQK